MYPSPRLRFSSFCALPCYVRQDPPDHDYGNDWLGSICHVTVAFSKWPDLRHDSFPASFSYRSPSFRFYTWYIPISAPLSLPHPYTTSVVIRSIGDEYSKDPLGLAWHRLFPGHSSSSAFSVFRSIPSRPGVASPLSHFHHSNEQESIFVYSTGID